jgi:hypothetical protein
MLKMRKSQTVQVQLVNITSIESEERSNEKSIFEEENKTDDEVKKEKNNKRDIDQVESNDSKEHDENAVLTTPNKKIKILEPLTDETIE